MTAPWREGNVITLAYGDHLAIASLWCRGEGRTWWAIVEHESRHTFGVNERTGLVRVRVHRGIWTVVR